MATISLKGYGATVTVLSGASELNSLATGNLGAVSGTGSGVVLDNTTNLNLYADFELITGTLAAAPTVGNTCDLYMSTSLDGTNYEVMPAAGTTAPQSWKRVGSFSIETVGTSQRIHIWRVPLVPGKMKFQLMNNSGAAFPASGASVVAYPYSMTVA